MTRKTITVYSLLFLCAFAFGLSFTLARDVKAEANCCIYEWCDYYTPPRVGAWGHWKAAGCEFDGTDSCDVAYECPEN
jgi:hypothetical protein